MKIGLVSHKFQGNKSKTIAKTIELIEKVAKNGADLVVLQELHQNHYFCQVENTQNFELGDDFNDDVKLWSDVAKKFGIVLVTSLFERRAAGLYHNTAVVFERDGSVAGEYRKMHIPDDPNFYEKFYFTPGDLGFEPIDTSVGRIGVMVCWDQWFPEGARLMALKGAQILIYPTAIGWFESDEKKERERQLEAWIGVQRGHAIANGVPVVAVNRIGFESEKLSKFCENSQDFIDNFTQNYTDFNANNNLKFHKTNLQNRCLRDENSVKKSDENLPSGINFWGNSFIFGPQGEEIFRANFSDEIAQVVEIDEKRCDNVRRWWPFLRDRRIENYSDLTKRFRN